MSYDLRFLIVQPDEDVPEAAERLNDDFDQNGSLDQSRRVAMTELARAIEAELPEFKTFTPDFDAIASAAGIRPDEARLQVRHVELNEEPDPVHGIQISIHAEEVCLTIAYWHTRADAEAAFDVIERVAGLLKARGFRIYDPQFDEEVTLPRDRARMLDCYCSTVAQMDTMWSNANQASPNDDKGRQRKKPWWRFW